MVPSHIQHGVDSQPGVSISWSSLDTREVIDYPLPPPWPWSSERWKLWWRSKWWCWFNGLSTAGVLRLRPAGKFLPCPWSVCYFCLALAPLCPWRMWTSASRGAGGTSFHWESLLLSLPSLPPVTLMATSQSLSSSWWSQICTGSLQGKRKFHCRKSQGLGFFRHIICPLKKKKDRGMGRITHILFPTILQKKKL